MKTHAMKNFFRPKFRRDQDKWRKLVTYMREIGIEEATGRLFPGNDEVRRTEQGEDKAAFEYKGERPITSLAEAIQFFEIDTAKWEVDRWVSNAWDVSMKNDAGEAVKRTNYQVKVWLRTKKRDWEDFKRELAQSIKPIVIKANRVGKRRKYAVEINITDLHIGKVGFDIETLSHNWTIEEAGKAYRAVIADVLQRIPADDIDHFILPTGGDLLNINSGRNETVRGTPQMTAQFFQQLFLFTRRMIAETVINLAKIAPVYVYLVPGNHDGDAVFAMGEALSAQFSGSEDVHVDNTPILRKYHKWGKNLIGFSHGDKIKAAELYNAMSNDRPRDFGEAKFRFFHVGHLHKNLKRRKIDLVLKDEHHGVEVEICPSLSPTDEWHYQNLYIGNMRRSKTFVYDSEHGKVLEFYFNL